MSIPFKTLNRAPRSLSYLHLGHFWSHHSMSNSVDRNSTGSMRSICRGSVLRRSSCRGCLETGFAISWVSLYNALGSLAGLCCSFGPLAEHRGYIASACHWSIVLEDFANSLPFPIMASSGKCASACFRCIAGCYSVMSGWASASSWCSSQLQDRILRAHLKYQNGTLSNWHVEPQIEQRDSASLRILARRACWCQSRSSWTSYRMTMGCFRFVPLLWSRQINVDSNCSNSDMVHWQDYQTPLVDCSWFDWME